MNDNVLQAHELRRVLELLDTINELADGGPSRVYVDVPISVSVDYGEDLPQDVLGVIDWYEPWGSYVFRPDRQEREQPAD